MTRQLFPHQIKGANFLADRNVAGLFAGMGTGKTLTSLEAVKMVNAERVVVVAPPIALPMWAKEGTEWTGLKSTILKTGKTPLPKSGIVVVSYAIATKRQEELALWVAQADISAVIFDESHALKNVKAKRTTALIGKGGLTDGTTDHIWFLTGTPITRWNDDMYPFLARAAKKDLNTHCGGVSLDRFSNRYTVRQKKQYSARMRPAWVTVANRHTAELAELTYADAAMRVDLEDVYKDMPPLTTNAYTIPLDMDAEAKAALQDLDNMTIAEIQEKGAKSPELATLRRYLGLSKVKAAAAEIADRIESGQNVLVGAWHTEVIDELAKALSKYEVAIIDGRQSSNKKEDVVARWNEGKVQCIVGQIAAMGVSLNLQQGGSQIIVVEEDWSPTIMDQFYARLWRYGQEKHVHVDILRADNKIDIAMSKIAAAKAQQAYKFNLIGKEMTDA